MSWEFGKRSLLYLSQVHPDLEKLAVQALIYSPVEFEISEGVRDNKRQAALFAAGATHTMRSRHLTGHALDVAAYVDGKLRWDFNLYQQIAVAFGKASDQLKIPVEWGAVWQPIHETSDLAHMIAEYTAACKRDGKNPLIDGPHFQLPWSTYP